MRPPCWADVAMGVFWGVRLPFAPLSTGPTSPESPAMRKVDMHEPRELREDGARDTLSSVDGAVIHLVTLSWELGEYVVEHDAWMVVGRERMPVTCERWTFENYHIARAQFEWTHENPPTEVAASH